MPKEFGTQQTGDDSAIFDGNDDGDDFAAGGDFFDGNDDDDAGGESDVDETGASLKSPIFGDANDDDDDPNASDDDDEVDLLDGSKGNDSAPAGNNNEELLTQILSQVTKPQPAAPAANAKAGDDTAPSEEDLVKELVAASTLTVPQEYMDAIQGDDPALATKAMNGLLAAQTSKVVTAMMKQVKKQVTDGIDGFKTQNTQQTQQQQQATQMQQRLEQDFTSRFPDIANLGAVPEYGGILRQAAATVAQSKEAQSFTSEKQFTEAVARQFKAVVGPVMAASGIKFTAAGLKKLLTSAQKQPGDKTRKSPPKRLSGSSGGKGGGKTPAAESPFDFEDL